MSNDSPDFMKSLEELALLAIHRSIPAMEDMNAGEMSCKVKFTHKNGTRYQATILVYELDDDGNPNI